MGKKKVAVAEGDEIVVKNKKGRKIFMEMKLKTVNIIFLIMITTLLFKTVLMKLQLKLQST